MAVCWTRARSSPSRVREVEPAILRAAAEIREAAAWWAANRPAAPGAFQEELRQAYALNRVKSGRVEVLASWHSSLGQTPGV